MSDEAFLGPGSGTGWSVDANGDVRDNDAVGSFAGYAKGPRSALFSRSAKVLKLAAIALAACVFMFTLQTFLDHAYDEADTSDKDLLDPCGDGKIDTGEDCDPGSPNLASESAWSSPENDLIDPESACDEYCRCKQGYESSGGTGSCRRVAPQPPAAVDCVERIAAVSTCAAVGQELHAVTTAAAHGGAACTGASKRCAAGDGSIPPAASQMIAIIWNLTGVDAGCRGPWAADAGNACGVHIHAGTSCANASGHLYEPVSGSDPWPVVRYTAVQGANSTSAISASDSGVRVAAGLAMADIVGHVMVVHDAKGNRIACGPIVPRGRVPSFVVYPGYTGVLTVAGSVTVVDPGPTQHAADPYSKPTAPCDPTSLDCTAGLTPVIIIPGIIPGNMPAFRDKAVDGPPHPVVPEDCTSWNDGCDTCVVRGGRGGGRVGGGRVLGATTASCTVARVGGATAAGCSWQGAPFCAVYSDGRECSDATTCIIAGEAAGGPGGDAGLAGDPGPKGEAGVQGGSGEALATPLTLVTILPGALGRR